MPYEQKGNAKSVVCLMGPTASGKTRVAVDLVKSHRFEIISVDSAQIYKHMNIGTAKPDKKTLEIAPHRLIDFLDPAQSYSVAEFIHDAEREIEAILKKGNMPLLTGGTMMYFNALQKGLAVLPDANEKIRQDLQNKAQAEGLNKLYAKLQKLDPVSAAKIHANDSQRIMRALEVILISGNPLSELHKKNTAKAKYTFYNFALLPEERSKLHQRIELRFDEMLQQGFLEEVSNLYQRKDLKPDMPSMRSVGYRQLWKHLDGEYSFKEARERGIIATRQLAKRQITWLRSWDKLTSINNAQDILAKFGI